MDSPACHRCGRASVWFRVKLAHGTAVTARCTDCDASAVRGRAFWPARMFSLRELSAMPLRATGNLGLCAVCNAQAALEEHHLAPRHLFPADDGSREDANAWPVVSICGKCHELWHDRLTPNMSHARRAS